MTSLNKKEVVKVDRLRLFLGRPILFGEKNIGIHSPTINQIVEVGDFQYSVNLLLCSFDRDRIMKNLFGFKDEQIDELGELKDYDFFAETISQDKGNDGIRNEFCKAISFFVKEEVEFDVVLKCFKCKKGIIVDKSNYREFSGIVNTVNGIDEEKKEEKPKKFLTKAVERAYMASQKRKEEMERIKREKEGLELKDVVSILCNANGNGINVFNVGDLSIYQVYESFERMNLKEMYIRVLQVWANGHWDSKKNKFPEWIVKSKM